MLTKLCIIACFSVFRSEAVSIESCLKSCKDNQINPECLTDSITKLVEKLKHVDKMQLKGLQSLDPLVTDDFDIYKPNGTVQLNQSYTDVKIYGLLNTTVNKSSVVSGDENKWTLNMTSLTVNFTLTGKYVLVGNFSELPLNGSGNCKITLVNLTCQHIVQGRKVTVPPKMPSSAEDEDNDVDEDDRKDPLMKVDDYKITLQPEDVIYDFENLFPDEQAMQAARAVSKMIFAEVKSGYETVFAGIMKDLLTKLFEHIHKDGTLCKD